MIQRKYTNETLNIHFFNKNNDIKTASELYKQNIYRESLKWHQNSFQKKQSTFIPKQYCWL